MKKVCLIFNPVSGSGNAFQDLKQICEILTPHVDLEVRFTAPDLSAIELTHQAIAHGAEMIIASGGDGTVSHVANVLDNTDIVLAVIPRGTANAFAAALTLPTDVKGACESILSGLPRRIDTATCNGEQMILLAGVGLEAKAISETDRETKQKFGFFAYLATAFKQLNELTTFTAELEFKTSEDGSVEQKTVEEVLAITVANLAPNTSILAHGTHAVSGNDGLLDVTILTMPEKSEVLGVLSASYELFKSSFKEDMADHPNIQALRVNSLRVQADPPQDLLLDGDLMGETPVNFQVNHLSLLVQFPQEKPEESQESTEAEES
ncbi:MAG: lipid kinase [Limnothrix sp. RL_2_0]|nr:lipid kinase [Limnothrix sp. RL_2_0]